MSITQQPPWLNRWLTTVVIELIDDPIGLGIQVVRAELNISRRKPMMAS